MESVLNQIGKILVELQITLSLLIPVQASILPQNALIPPIPQEIPKNLTTGKFSSSSRAIIGIIEREAKTYGVNPELALYLAKIESNYEPRAKNPSSTAKGIYQWIDSSWSENCQGDVYDPVDNIVCAMKTISKGGLRHWTADKTIKSKLLTAEFIR